MISYTAPWHVLKRLKCCSTDTCSAVFSSLLPHSQKRGDRNNLDVLQLMDAQQKWEQHTIEYHSPARKSEVMGLKKVNGWNQ